MAFKIPDTPEELFRQGKRNFDTLYAFIPLLILLVIAATVVLSSFYSIDPDEVGIIRRFGKYNRTTMPGLHWKMPLNIEELNKVKVERVFKEEFGFRTTRAGQPSSSYSGSNFDAESLMLTGDVNVLDVTWVVQFKIKDPVKYLFNVRDAQGTVRDISESVMRQVIGDSSVTEALTSRRIEINEEAEEKLQEILDFYDSGIHIVNVILQDVNPPDQVKPSFNEVNQAKQEMEKMINQAWENYNKIIPAARGEAEKTIQEAEGYALRRVNRAQGDAAKFIATWEAYKDSRDVTRQRLYLETLSEVLPNAGHIYVVEPKMSGPIPLLNLNEVRQ